MRVLILANHLEHSLGGIEIQCDLIAQELTKSGHRVFYGTPPLKDGQVRSYPYELLGCNLRSAFSVRRAIRAASPDVIYLRNNKVRLLNVALAAKLSGVPLIFAASSLQDVQAWSFHASNQRWTLRRFASVAFQRLRSRWNWLGFHFVDGAVSLNTDYTDRLPVKNRMHIADSMGSVAEPFNWPRPFIAWVAQLKNYKHPEEFVELARNCNDTGLDFLMVGGLAHRSYVWITEHRGTPENFHYLGSMSPNQVNGFLAASEFMVHTCEPEGFGNNFIQAWLMGKPTLSLRFDPGGLINGLELGRVPGTIAGLTREVKVLFENKQEAELMGRRALSHARTHYDPETNVNKLIEFFQSVITKKHGK